MLWALQNWEKSGFFIAATLPFMVNWRNPEFLKDDRTRAFFFYLSKVYTKSQLECQRKANTPFWLNISEMKATGWAKLLTSMCFGTRDHRNGDLLFLRIFMRANRSVLRWKLKCMRTESLT